MIPIAQFDSLIPADRLKAVQDYFARDVRWVYGWPQGQQDPYSHWNMDFLNISRKNQDNMEEQLRANPEFRPVADIWDALKAGPMRGHHLVRCYANAHTYGVEGYIHTDSPHEDNHTAVVYLNPAWKPEWAGELVFLDEAGDVLHAVMPKPGRVAAMPGNTPHVARAVSRTCPAIRVSLNFKTRAADMIAPEKLLIDPVSRRVIALLPNGIAPERIVIVDRGQPRLFTPSSYETVRFASALPAGITARNCWDFRLTPTGLEPV